MCVFCDIASRRRPAHVVLEDDHSLGFLDHRPVFPGHCLLIPKTHHETLSDLPEDLVSHLFLTTQQLARAVEGAMSADGSFVALNNKVSQSVPHVHVHVVPRRRKDGLRGFFWPRHPYRDEREMSEIADRLRTELRAHPAPGPR